MKYTKLFAFFCAACFLVGCASAPPKPQSDYKPIPGGEIIGKANNYRPQNIKYQKVPDNVQYVLASDEKVIEVYNKLKADLASDDAVFQFKKTLYLKPGAWARIDEIQQTGAFNKRTRTYDVNLQTDKFKLRYAVPKTAKSRMGAWNIIKRDIRYPAFYSAEAGSPEANALGEISIRSINPEEMTTIFWFNPFKIVEPTFVVNDKYLLEFDKDGNLDMIDYIPYYLQYQDRVKAALEEYERQKKEYERKKLEYEKSQQK